EVERLYSWIDFVCSIDERRWGSGLCGLKMNDGEIVEIGSNHTREEEIGMSSMLLLILKMLHGHQYCLQNMEMFHQAPIAVSDFIRTLFLILVCLGTCFLMVIRHRYKHGII
nr:hypothetical protein [Tanacetum cinerariifolium]